MPEEIQEIKKNIQNDDVNEKKIENVDEKVITNDIPLEGGEEEKDYKGELMKDFDVLQDKNRSLNSMKIINKNKIKETRIKVIQELFGIMEEMGVDPNNMESINSFLTTLEEQDPDLKELFEYAFTNITEEETPPSVMKNDTVPVRSNEQIAPTQIPESNLNM